ncbi:MAG: hypothetical protein KDD66_07430 [Bdellovibrionales bacterium]|nr:hypothetical protein [Bdellovibrionales bacterium]
MIEARSTGDFGRVLMIAGDNRKDHHGFPLPENERELRQARLRRRKRAEHLGRRRPPEGADSALYALSWLGMTMEEVVRDWLYEQGFELDPRHEIYYTERGEDGRECPATSREVDAVVVDRRGRPRMLVEVRLSVQGMRAIHSKMYQLGTTLSILRTQPKWKRLKPLIVYIAVGDHQNEVQTAPNWLVSDAFDISPQWQRAYHPDEIIGIGIPRIVIPLAWLWNYALGLGWELEEDLWVQAEWFARDRARRMDERTRERLESIREEAEREGPPPH